jgi:selenocysteine-specific elongation factor
MKQHQHLPASQDRVPTKSVVVGTAGHIDHGKTALVYALTGIDTDRLPEEKRRGITIDLGFAALQLPDGRGGLLHLSLVDVPGHQAFVRNMLAGAGGIDCVMLVIAADEGVKAQTEEHLAICSLLGIRHGLTVLTKKDAVDADRLQQTWDGVRKFLQRTFLQDAPILAVSASTGEGIAEVKKALSTVASQIPERSNDYVLRLPLDRAFSMRGFGTVVTGTLQQGSVRTGDLLEQHPSGRMVRVRGVQVHGEQREAAQAPCRVALNLAGAEVAEIRRGDTLVPPGILSAASALDVELSMLPGAPRIRHRSKVRVHAFTSETLAAVLLYGPNGAEASGLILARLQLSKPLLVIPGDRVVLRQCSPATTIAGGRVLDAHVLPGMKKSAVLSWLRAIQNADSAECLRLRVSRRGTQGIVLQDLIAETGMTADSLHGHLAPFLSNGHLVGSGHDAARTEHLVTAEALQQAMGNILGQLKAVGSGSMPKAELQSKARLGEPIYQIAIRKLNEAHSIGIRAEAVTLAGRGDAIPAERLRLLTALEDVYAAAGLAAPLLSEVSLRLGVKLSETRNLITLLLRSRRLVRMGADDAFVHSVPLGKLYADMRNHKGQTFDVARFKSFTGLSRKHAIPLLEHLDQVHVTRNTGGVRVVL